MKFLCRDLILLASLLLVSFVAHATDCEMTAFEQLTTDSRYGVSLTSAESVDETGGYCRVEGEIANADDGQSQIKFRLRLPDAAAWNGKFMVIGNGGTAGAIQGAPRNNIGRAHV